MKRILAALASIPITLFGLVLITFLIGRVVPIDPVLAIVGDRAPQDVVDRTRHEMGLDRPLPEQFLRYTEQLAVGNLGRSVMTTNPVTTDIARFFPATLELATVALLVATLVGVPLGVWAATRQGSAVDQVIRVVCLSGHSIPVFVLALVSLLVFYATLGWAPGPGRQDVLYQDMVPPITGILLIDAALAGDWDSFRDAARHLVLPALVLGAFNMAYIARMTRAFMLDALGGEYITTARAKGLSVARVVWRHAFGNILVRLVTVVAPVLRRAAGGRGADRDGVLLARPRPVPYRVVAERRHERGAGGDACRGAVVCGAQPVRRPDVPPAGPARPMTSTVEANRNRRMGATHRFL